MVLFLLVASNRHNISAALNVPIRYDDFVFTILSARVKGPKATPTSDRKPALSPYVVTLRIDNRAKRVSFQFDENAPIVVDAKGRMFHLSQEARRAHERSVGGTNPTARSLPPGTSVTKDLVFEVPEDFGRPKMKTGQGLGDILETVLFGQKQFLLP